MVRQWWSFYQFYGNPSYILACKLKALKNDLKLWNSQSFGDIRERKKFKVEELQQFEQIMETRALSPEELLRKSELVAELERILSLEEIS